MQKEPLNRPIAAHSAEHVNAPILNAEIRKPMSAKAIIERLNPTRQSLISRLKNWDDQESWRQAFDTYAGMIYSFAFRAGLSDAEAQEVVQETFIVLAKQMREDQYDRTKGSFKAWLQRNSRWRIDEQLRKRKHRPPPRAAASTEKRTPTVERIPDPASLNLDKIYEDEWRENLFSLAVERLKEKVDAKQFQIFDLYVLKKWPVRKIASTLGVSSGRVYLAKFRLSKLVDRELKELKRHSF
jgi:RNA polymerase sigma factor (sigma-70 family)